MDQLFGVMDQLEESDLNRFKSFLQDKTLAGFKPIPRGKLQNCDSTGVVMQMRDSYGQDGAVALTRHILLKMNKVYLLEYM
ncbi:caspase b-like [Sardina pilchardus]|uniref:caspase b-like n=1 Tax=Sardina pilchardus TaxID=27697 RepID=UPI002E11EBAA